MKMDIISTQEVVPGNDEVKNMDSKPSFVEEDESSSCETDKGRKRALRSGGPNAKKKKFPQYQVAKSALMQLNELKPRLKYVFEAQQGPFHEPTFVVSVEVNNQKFVGKGSSKQLAKHAAAEAALASFVQFPDMPEAMYALSKRITSYADFTDDNIENKSFIFNEFGEQEDEHNSNSFDSSLVVKKKLSNKLRKMISEADKKNPVHVLNALHPGLTFNLIEENASSQSQRFVMSLIVNGEKFVGFGQNKKAAKAMVAKSALSKLYNMNFSAFSIPIPKPMLDPDVFSFPQSVADDMAQSIFNTFNEIMDDNPEHAKWKVLAGIILTKDEKMTDMQVVGIGTGTKHLNGEHMSMNGASLNDCHAEIISRRCLKDFLYTQLELHFEGEGDLSILERGSDDKFVLKPHHKFHLFISTSPCGDARIFSVHDDCEKDLIDPHPNRKARGILRAKIESGEGTIPIKTEQPVQTWDAILQGQERYITMSCSDKIASWNVLGVQGSLLSHFLEPIYLHSIILGHLFHRDHIYRAMCGRLEALLKSLPAPYHLNKPKICFSTTLETKHVAKPPNFSINWTSGLGRPETVIARTGKTESGHISRLSKRSFFHRFFYIHGILFSADTETAQSRMYSSVKSSASSYCEAKQVMLEAFAKAGLGSWVKKPPEQDEFELVF